MERIAIITPDGTRIKEYLDNNMVNVEISTFNDIFVFYNRVKRSAFRADTLLMMDNGLKDTTYNSGTIDNGAALLKEVLADMPLVEIERLIYLNTEKNVREYELIEFLKESKHIKVAIILARYPVYQAITIKELLINNSQTYQEGDYSHRYVIRKKRNEKTSSRLLNQFETDKAVVLEYGTKNTNIDLIKGQLNQIVGKENIPETLTDESVIEPIDTNISDVEISNRSKPLIIAVIGDSKSGATVTSTIMGASASTFEKTLLIDMNFTNLGLSYLAEKTLLDEQINNIKLADIISVSDGVVKLREQVFQKNQLHVLTNSLPAKKQMTQNEFGFAMANILRMYKNSYKYIIIDMPVDELSSYSNVLTMVDKVLLCTPPYMNNIISLLTKVSDSPLVKSQSFSVSENDVLRDVILFRTKVFSRVNKEIKAINIDVINRYSKALLKSKLKVTGIYQYDPKTYLDTVLFQSIINQRGGQQ